MKSRVYPLILMSLAVVAGISVTSSYFATTYSNANHSQKAKKEEASGVSPSLVSNAVELPLQLDITSNATYSHDPRSFTQGLEYHEGELYEGTGNYGSSKLRRVELKTGKVLQEIALGQQYFGEGITILNDKIYQLTWRENACFVYDKKTFRHEQSFRYKGEGWGIANDGTHLIVSNGTSTLQYFDPQTFRVLKTVEVREGTKKIVSLNELEFIRGEVWANVWETNYIVRINPKSGQVIGWIDCSGFVPKDITKHDRERVLNGIAFDAATQRVFIAGKFWPVIYELHINESKK